MVSSAFSSLGSASVFSCIDSVSLVPEKQFWVQMMTSHNTENLWTLFGNEALADSDIFKYVAQVFDAIDTDGNGRISRDELRESYCRYENATLRLALGLAVVPPPRPESWDTPAEAPAEARWSLADEMFDRIDANGDGAISNRELRSYLKDTGYSLTTIDGIYDALDLNKDNEVSRTELRSAFGRYEHKTLMVALGVRALA